MCHYENILAEGPALFIQVLTLLAIAGSIVFWAWLYRKKKVELKAYLLPLVLWIVFGSLDILITAKGTYGEPDNETNPLAEFIFVQADPWGPPLASVLWIGLWAGIVLALNRWRVPYASFISLGVFYGLAFGHLRGFSSWFEPLCGIISFAPLELHVIIVAGIVLAAAHVGLGKLFNLKRPDS